MAHNKRLAATYAAVDRAKLYTLEEAVTAIKANAKAKFDETIEFSMNLGIDPRQRRPDGPRYDQPAERHG